MKSGKMSLVGLLNWILGRRPHRELPVAPEDLKIRLVPKAFDPDGEESNLMWYGLTAKNNFSVPIQFSGEVQRRRHTPKKALQMPCFNPPCHMKLVLEDDNQFDANAVAVYDQSGKTNVGYVP